MFFFSSFQWRYCIRIENLGQETVQLRERHWRIFSLSGTLETVRGRGVVGQVRLTGVVSVIGRFRIAPNSPLPCFRLILRNPSYHRSSPLSSTPATYHYKHPAETCGEYSSLVLTCDASISASERQVRTWKTQVQAQDRRKENKICALLMSAFVPAS